jgi:phosphatidylserine decarboxylase precursor
MVIHLSPLPSLEDVPQLKPLVELMQHADVRALLEASLRKAGDIALNGDPKNKIEPLNPDLYNALPWSDTPWPTTADEYIAFLLRFAFQIPQESGDPAWLESPLGEHQEVYDRLCFSYWLIDQPVGPNGGVVQDIPEFKEFLVGYAKAWGAFLDTTMSFNDKIRDSFIKRSPKYRVEDSMIDSSRRPNAASGWLTFNQFFARELNPGLRPIAALTDNTTITAPADCTYKTRYAIGADSSIEPILIKGTHTYANVKSLLKDSRYMDSFANGHFVHFFLGPYSYHRFHTPVAGRVMECYPLTGEVYLKVQLGNGQFLAADSAENGYEFSQARGVLIIDTAESRYGDVGIVAVIPVGMCQVSGVNMTHEINTNCDKGDEFGYFTFGGSDIIVLLQAGTNPVYNAAFDGKNMPYSLYGSEIAAVKRLGKRK